MRACIQRVSRAAVAIAGTPHATIGRGLLVLLGVGPADQPADDTWLAGKVARLRIFPDERDLMRHNVVDLGLEVLVVSQFTLYADTRGGNRPSFTGAARPELAIPRYEGFCAALSALLGRPVATGVFAADMQVELVNDGPVTIWIDSAERAAALRPGT
jgi:D-tyrosyl-tRNA(Tyr) deacylase